MDNVAESAGQAIAQNMANGMVDIISTAMMPISTASFIMSVILIGVFFTLCGISGKLQKLIALQEQSREDARHYQMYQAAVKKTEVA